MGKVNVLVPKKEGQGFINVTATWDPAKNALIAPNSETVLNKSVVFLAEQQSDNAAATLAYHAGYRHIGE
jgi:hypothetical protein